MCKSRGIVLVSRFFCAQIKEPRGVILLSTVWNGVINMAKKREHIVFDQMLKTKKSIPFGKINRQQGKRTTNIYNKYMENASDTIRQEMILHLRNIGKS